MSDIPTRIGKVGIRLGDFNFLELDGEIVETLFVEDFFNG